MSASHATIAAGYISMAEQELEQDLASTMKTSWTEIPTSHTARWSSFFRTSAW
jgi:hypothetical protein